MSDEEAPVRNPLTTPPLLRRVQRAFWRRQGPARDPAAALE